MEDVLGLSSRDRAYTQVKALGLCRIYKGKVTKAAKEWSHWDCHFNYWKWV